MLGAGIQTAMRAIARGDIGEPLTATTLFHVPGPEAWHPNPEFLFAAGAGPLFDMGPYYVTTLVHAFGPAATGQRRRRRRRATTRTIGSGPAPGTEFPVEVPTHHAALISFEGGQSAQSTFSFQNALPRMGFVEISGTEGTIVLPDPNMFDGRLDAVALRAGRAGDAAGRRIHLRPRLRRARPRPRDPRRRRRARDRRARRARARRAARVSDAAESGQPVEVASTVPKPTPLPEELGPGRGDAVGHEERDAGGPGIPSSRLSPAVSSRSLGAGDGQWMTRPIP